MLAYNHDLFVLFKTIHDKFVLDPETNRSEFNRVGEGVLRVMGRYENILCGKTESGKYGQFSTNLSDKFRDEVKVHFPQIDFVGAK